MGPLFKVDNDAYIVYIYSYMIGYHIVERPRTAYLGQTDPRHQCSLGLIARVLRKKTKEAPYRCFALNDPRSRTVLTAVVADKSEGVLWDIYPSSTFLGADIPVGFQALVERLRTEMLRTKTPAEDSRPVTVKVRICVPKREKTGDKFSSVICRLLATQYGFADKGSERAPCPRWRVLTLGG